MDHVNLPRCQNLLQFDISAEDYNNYTNAFGIQNYIYENNGNLLSVDIDDYTNLFQNNKWKFIHSRDDNFEIINKEISKMGGLDVLYIDSFHEPNHVKKLFYNYYKLLNKNGFIFVDDISWLPYAKSSYRESSLVHEMNLKTFEKIF